LCERLGGEDSGRKRRIVESEEVRQQLDGSDMSEIDSDTDNRSVYTIKIDHYQSNKSVMASESPPIFLIARIPPRSPGPTSTG